MFTWPESSWKAIELCSYDFFDAKLTNGKKHPKKICIKNFGGTLTGGSRRGLRRPNSLCRCWFSQQNTVHKEFRGGGGGGAKGVLGVGSKVQFWGPISLCLCAFLGLETLFYCKTHSRPPSQRTPSPEPCPEPSQNLSQNAVLPYAPLGVHPRSARLGTRTKMFIFLGFRTQRINFPEGPGIEKIRSRPSGLKISSDRSWIEIFDRAPLGNTRRAP